MVLRHIPAKLVGKIDMPKDGPWEVVEQRVKDGKPLPVYVIKDNKGNTLYTHRENLTEYREPVLQIQPKATPIAAEPGQKRDAQRKKPTKPVEDGPASRTRSRTMTILTIAADSESEEDENPGNEDEGTRRPNEAPVIPPIVQGQLGDDSGDREAPNDRGARDELNDEGTHTSTLPPNPTSVPGGNNCRSPSELGEPGETVDVIYEEPDIFHDTREDEEELFQEPEGGNPRMVPRMDRPAREPEAAGPGYELFSRGVGGLRGAEAVASSDEDSEAEGQPSSGRRHLQVPAPDESDLSGAHSAYRTAESSLREASPPLTIRGLFGEEPIPRVVLAADSLRSSGSTFAEASGSTQSRGEAWSPTATIGSTPGRDEVFSPTGSERSAGNSSATMAPPNTPETNARVNRESLTGAIVEVVEQRPGEENIRRTSRNSRPTKRYQPQ